MSRSKSFEDDSAYVGVIKLTPVAAFPRKVNDLSPCYSLTLAQREDNRAEDTAYRVEKFLTNLAFKIPEGYYIEITANSFLANQGYFLAQGTVIVTPNDTDELVISLYKYAEMPDLELPSEVLQFTVCKTVDSFCSLLKGSELQSSKDIHGFNTNNTFYQPQQQKSRQDQPNLSRTKSAFMPDFGETSPSHSSSSRSTRSSKNTHLF